MKKRWYVYILKMADNSLYTGVTIDLKKRLKSHASGKGSKYVRSRLPIKEIHMGEALDKTEAMQLEYRIKQLDKKDKIKTLLGEL